MRVAIGVGNLEILAKSVEDFFQGHGWVITDPASDIIAEARRQAVHEHARVQGRRDA